MKLNRIYGRGEEVLILEIRTSPAPSLCSEESQGLGLRPTKWHLAALSILPPGSVVSGCGARSGVGEDGSLPGLGELPLPLS